MKHIYNYIIKISNDLNETFTTENGVKLYGHKDFNKDRMSNRYATIVGLPMLFDGEILDKGTEVMIDPSVYYHSIHGDDDVKQYTTNTINRKEGLYAIEPQNIVLYKQNDTWCGYLNNFLGKQFVEKKEGKTTNGIIVELGKTKRTDKYEVIYDNAFLRENGVKKGDSLFIRPNYGVSMWIEGKEYKWLRDSDTLAKIEGNG